MPLMEAVIIRIENHTKNNEAHCAKLWIFLMLGQVMHVF
jgi:hypothetical protein